MALRVGSDSAEKVLLRCARLIITYWLCKPSVMRSQVARCGERVDRDGTTEAAETNPNA